MPGDRLLRIIAVGGTAAGIPVGAAARCRRLDERTGITIIIH